MIEKKCKIKRKDEIEELTRLTDEFDHEARNRRWTSVECKEVSESVKVNWEGRDDNNAGK